MKPNKNQQAYLDSLICQRISDDEENREVIDVFKNYQNPGLPAALRKAWNTDKKGKVAYYIVKEPDGGMPLLFFALRCGEMHTPLSHEKLEKTVENNKALVDAALGREAPDWAKEIVEKRKVNGILPYHKFAEFVVSYERSLARLRSYVYETNVEGTNIIRTKQSFAGVELAFLCIHEPAKARWEAMGMAPQKIGRTLYWQFVVPVVQQIRDLVGLEYLYLFAADHHKAGKLTNYYQELGFEFGENINVTKPQYDFSCYFMWQKVTSLRNRQKEFFRNYNPDEN